MSDGDTTKRDARVLPLPGDTLQGASLLPLPRPGELSVTALEERSPAPTAPAPAARRLGGYEVERELARGGMGIVYVARSLRLGRRVALKVLQAGAFADAEEVERFLLEARAVARLRHANIVAVHEVDRDGATWFLAMDLIEGGSLRGRVLRDGPLPLRQAAALARDVARALHHAHERGIVHRDVKPHNVLLDAAGTPYVADFGLAKEVGRDGSGLTVTGQVVGTPAYMPPEQAQGDLARIDRRSDVYSLGATLFELLTGRPPFAASNAVALLRAVLEDEPPAPSTVRPEVDRDLETIVLTCLAKDGARRYDTCALLAEDLDRWLADEPIAARRPGALERAARWARRRPGLVAVALAAPLVVGAVAGGSVAAARRAAAREQVGVARAAVEAAEGALAAAVAPDQRVARAQDLLDAARRWLEVEPGDRSRRAVTDAALGLGDLARAAGDWSRAGDAYAQAGAAGLESVRAAAAVRWCGHLSSARAAEARGEPLEALAALDSALALDLGWPEAYLERARVLRDIGSGLTALREFDRYLAQRPDDLRALVERASARDLSSWREALADLDRAIALRPDAAWLRLKRAEVLIRAGQLREAIDDARRAVALAPAWGEAWGGLGWMLMRIDEVDEASAALERGVALAPEVVRLRHWLAECHLRRRDPRAVVEAERALALLPEDIPARLVLAAASLRLEGDAARARRELEAVLRASPRQPEALALLAEALQVEGDLPRARARAEEALAVDPANVTALLMRAQGRVREHDLAGARADVGRVLELAPGRAEAWLVLAAIERLEGAPGAALAASARAAAAAPRHGKVRLEAGVIHAELGQARAALAHFDAALELGERQAHVGRGVARLQLGELDPALADAEAGLAAGDPSGLLLRAMVHGARRDLARARADAAAFLREVPDDHPHAAKARELLERWRR